MNTSYNIYMLFFTLMVSTVMSSQKTLSKNINKTFDLTNTGELFLDNKYGDIIINGWEKDEIKISIKIEANNKKNDTPKELLDRIKPNFRVANNHINIVSEITERNTSIFSKYFKKANPFDLDKNNISINYTINLPTNATIEIINKFGDIILNDWTGKLKTTLKHGDIWITESIDNAEIDIKYGKLKTKSISSASITIKNGNIELDEAKYLNLKSNGSNIRINKVDKLDFISNKDDATFNYIHNIYGNLKFSSILIKELNKKINLTTKITDVDILKINQPNTSIKLNQTSSNININIEGLSFDFDATLEQGTLKLPKSFKNIETNMTDERNKIREIKASYGTTKSGSFSLTGKKGTITLIE